MKKSLLLFCFLALFGCARPQYADEDPGQQRDRLVQEGPCGDFCVKITWEKFPPEDDFGSFTFETRKNGLPFEPGFVPEIVLWMPAMNHGSSPVTVEGSGSEFRAKNIFFSMRGNWEIRFERKETHERLATVPFIF